MIPDDINDQHYAILAELAPAVSNHRDAGQAVRPTLGGQAELPASEGRSPGVSGIRTNAGGRRRLARMRMASSAARPGWRNLWVTTRYSME